MTVRKTKNIRPTRSAHKKSAGWKKWLKIGLKIFIAGCILLFLLIFITYFGFLGKVPSTEELARYKNPVASEVFSSDGQVLGRYYIENRSNANYREISKNVINALIATEDVRFFKHRGIDELALARVFFKTILSGERRSGGGSTLSQQIAKNIFPRSDLGLMTLPVSKIREAIIAYRLERIYSKEEILTLYLNTVPFGENIFGIEVAAERYFSKSPSQLTVPESAVLIGMLKANNVYNPRVHPGKSLERRNVVIELMVKNRFITAEQGARYKQQPLNIRYSLITYDQGPAPYLLENLRPVLQDWCQRNRKENGEPYNLYTDGLKIYTTIDYSMQKYATAAVRGHLKTVQSVFDNQWKNVKPWSRDKSVLDRAIKRTDRYRNGREAGKSHQYIMKEFSKPITTYLLTWDGLKQVNTTPLDSVRHYMGMLNAGCLVMDNHSGAVKAWVGGIDYRFFKFDYCNADRQVGSTFKPVVYLAALEQGLSPLKYYSSEKKEYEEFDNWTPGNATDHYSGYYTMKAALAQSINTVSVDIIMQTGVEKVIETARALGMKADLPAVPSLALGTASVSLREMVSTYAAIANLGAPLKSWTLLKIENNKGVLMESFKKPEPSGAKVDPENCRIITEMLKAVVQEGTGSGLRTRFNVPGDLAGKTGTTQQHADGWFIGFSPDYTAGCWVGADDPAIHFRELHYGQGAYMALPVVGKFFAQLYADPKFRGMLNHHFELPDSVTLEKMNALPGNVLKLEDESGIFNFLKKKPKKQEPPGVQPEKETKKDVPKKEEPVWEKIRRIFKKEK